MTARTLPGPIPHYRSSGTDAFRCASLRWPRRYEVSGRVAKPPRAPTMRAPRRTRHAQAIRQLVRRPYRPGERRLRRHADQRPALPEPGAGHRPQQGRSHGEADGSPGLRHVLDGGAPFPARRHRVHPQRPVDGAASDAPDEEPAHRLRLQHHADVASASPGRGLCDGGHPVARTRRVRGRPRLSHARGGIVRRTAARSGRQPRAVRGAGRDHLQILQRGVVQPQGQALHAAARGAVSRLYAEGAYAGAAAGAAAGGMLAADPERHAAGARLHGEARHLRRDRRRLGRGRRGAQVDGGLPGGLCARRQADRARRTHGAWLPVLPRRQRRTGHAHRGEVLRREHEDVRRAAAGEGADGRADRDHARSRSVRRRQNCRGSRMR